MIRMRVLFVNFNSLKRYLSVVMLYAQVAVPVYHFSNVGGMPQSQVKPFKEGS